MQTHTYTQTLKRILNLVKIFTFFLKICQVNVSYTHTYTNTHKHIYVSIMKYIKNMFQYIKFNNKQLQIS